MAAAALPKAGEDWLDPVAGIAFIWLDALEIWVGKYQVTNQQYRLAKPEHDSGEFRTHSLNGDRQPACCLSYEDSLDWCDWLTGQLKEQHGLQLQQTIRLPSDREWMSYATCGDGRTYPWGNQWPPTRGNYACQSSHEKFPDWDYIEGYRSGHAVSCNVQDSGRNEWGLYGVGGNCYEWTFESEGISVQLRGASWSTCQKTYLRVDNLYRREPKSRLLNFAFRPVMAC
jgi:formylglycine-generating enzyme required for sulfatase activity